MIAPQLSATRTRSLATAAALVTLVTALVTGSATPTQAAPERGQPAVTASTPAATNQALARARAATARYHDVDRALADGFVPVSPCIEAPGVGAMGVHLLNHDRVVDGVLDPAAPEILLYLPDARGRLELVGIEYLQVDADQDTGTDDDRPSLFGVPFDGPMDGHGPGEPVHYDLHVWLWKHNPAGLMAPFNAALSCPTAGPADHASH
jgi:hypothetical protein